MPLLKNSAGNYSTRMLDSARWAASHWREKYQSIPGPCAPQLQSLMLTWGLSFLYETVFLNSVPFTVSSKGTGSKWGGGVNSHFLLLFVRQVAPILILIGLHPLSLSQSEDPQSPRHTERKTQTEKEGERERKRERVREESGCGALFP